MAKELAIASARNLKNPKVANEVVKIDKMITNTKMSEEATKLALAKFAHLVKAGEYYKEEGFTSPAEMISSLYSIGNSTAYMYVQVGEALANGFPAKDKDGKAFTVVKIRNMLKIKDKEKVAAEIETGAINADMSEREIRERVDNMTPKRKTPEKKVFYFVETQSGEKSAMTEEAFTSWLTEKSEAFAKVKTKADIVYYVGVDCNGLSLAFRRDEYKETVEAES